MEKTISILMVGIFLLSSVSAIGNLKEANVLTTSVHVAFTKPMMKQTTINDQKFYKR